MKFIFNRGLLFACFRKQLNFRLTLATKWQQNTTCVKTLIAQLMRDLVWNPL